MPGNGFWLIFTLGAIALSIWGQSLPFHPAVHLVWGGLGSVYYIGRAKSSGEQLTAKVMAFVAGSLVVLSLFIFVLMQRLTSI